MAAPVRLSRLATSRPRASAVPRGCSARSWRRARARRIARSPSRVRGSNFPDMHRGSAAPARSGRRRRRRHGAPARAHAARSAPPGGAPDGRAPPPCRRGLRAAARRGARPESAPAGRVRRASRALLPLSATHSAGTLGRPRRASMALLLPVDAPEDALTTRGATLLIAGRLRVAPLSRPLSPPPAEGAARRDATLEAAATVATLCELQVISGTLVLLLDPSSRRSRPALLYALEPPALEPPRPPCRAARRPAGLGAQRRRNVHAARCACRRGWTWAAWNEPPPRRRAVDSAA